MNDINGMEILIGDEVVFAKDGRHALVKGRVAALYPNTVAVVVDSDVLKWDDRSDSKVGVETVYRDGENVVVVGRWV